MLEKLKELQNLINTSERKGFFEEGYGEYLTGNVTFTMGEKSYTMSFYNGIMIDVIEGTPLTGIDFGICGPEEGWQELFSHRNFSMAIAPKHGKLRHQGNLVRSMGNLNALGYLCRVLCSVVEEK